MYLGPRVAVGVLSPANLVTPGAWVVTFDPAAMPRDYDYEVYHGWATGPGGYFLGYIDGYGYDSAQNGKINEYTPTNGKYVRKGQTLSYHWSIATLPAPVIVLYLRTPKDV